MNKFFRAFPILFLSFITFSQGQQMPSVNVEEHNGYKNVVDIDCDYKFNPNQQVELSVNYPQIKSTQYYKVDNLEYSPEGSFTQGTEIKISKDDQWSNVIKFPKDFTFCYYGNSYDSFVIGDNGLVSFDITKSGTYCAPTFNGQITSFPGEFSSNTIFGAYHDMVYVNGVKGCVGDCGQIFVNVTGTAPFRKVVVNFNRMNHFNCAEKKSTFQIVLHETTNIIDVNIEDKPITCKTSSDVITKTLVGITDSEGKGVAPASRNSGEWAAAKETWRFIPMGIIAPTIQWYYLDKEGKEVAIKEGITYRVKVYPNQFAQKEVTYRAKVFYNACGLEYLSDDIKFRYADDYPVAENKNKNFCYSTDSYVPTRVDLTSLIKESIGGQDIANAFLYNTQAEADSGNKAKALNYTNVLLSRVTSSFYLRLEKGLQCYTTAKLSVSMHKSPEIRYKDPIELCIYEKEIPKAINLLNYKSNITTNGVVEFYNTQLEAENAENEIKELPVQLDSPTIIYAKVYNKNAPDCSTQIIPVTFRMKLSIEVLEYSYHSCNSTMICLIPNVYETLYKDKAKYYKFSYYISYEDAIEGDINKQIPADRTFCINEGTKIYVRIERENYCLRVGLITVGMYRPELPSLTKYYCTDPYGVAKVKVDLNDLVKEYFNKNQSYALLDIYENGILIEKSKYKDYQITKSTSFKVRYHHNIVGCDYDGVIYVSFYDRASDVIKQYDICDINNDGKELFYFNNLTNYMLSKYPKSKVTYYLSQEDLNNEKSTDSIQLIKDKKHKIYIKVQTENCMYIHEMDLNLIDFAFDKVQNIETSICDQNQDNKEKLNLLDYRPQIIENWWQYAFTYYEEYEDLLRGVNEIKFTSKNPGIYETKIPNTIYVKIVNMKDSSPCYGISELKFVNSNKIEVQDIPVDKCADNLSLEYIVDLTEEVKGMMLGDTQKMKLKINYFNQESEALDLSIQNNTILGDITKYKILSSQQYVWVRFTDETTGCYVVKNMNISLRSLPKIVKGSYQICDNNFDGIYSVNLEDLNTVLIEDTTDLKFEYYLKDNITGKLNPIKGKVLESKEFSDPSYRLPIYVKVINNYGCSNIEQVTLYTQEILKLKENETELVWCDEDYDGLTNIDLTTVIKEFIDNPQAEFKFYTTYEDAANNSQNWVKNPKAYRNIKSYQDQVYFRVSVPGYCPTWGKINLKINIPPKHKLATTYRICPTGSIELDAGNDPDIVSYEWGTKDGKILTDKTKQSIIVESKGVYWVKLTGKNGCTITVPTNVLEHERVVITNFIEGKDYVTVEAEGPRPLEYSMDQVNWTRNNTFSNLDTGVYTFYVRSLTNNCYSPEKKAILFKIPNTITPNGDGQNDVWKMCGLEHFDDQPSKIKIFDRYGKVVFEDSSADCFTWDGFYLGRPLPTTSYWYVVDVADGRQFTGWIVLRNYKE